MVCYRSVASAFIFFTSASQSLATDLGGDSNILSSESSIAEDVPSGRPNPNPPPYTLVRYSERYDYLADPSLRKDHWDPLKYIPLGNEDTHRYLSLGGEVRERYELFHNDDFGVAGPNQNEFLMQRLMLHADLHLNERLRFFIQGISAVQYGGDFKTPVNHNPLDLQQAFVDYTFSEPTPEGDRVTVRGGRFSMSYGSGRLIATRAAPNTPLKFEGLQMIGSSGGASKLYAFATRPVEEFKYKADRANEKVFFYGLYASKPISPYLAIDLYYLGLKNEEAEYVDASGTEKRHTVGMRLFGEWEGWDYNLEPVYQYGISIIKILELGPLQLTSDIH